MCNVIKYSLYNILFSFLIIVDYTILLLTDYITIIKLFILNQMLIITNYKLIHSLLIKLNTVIITVQYNNKLIIHS